MQKCFTIGGIRSKKGDYFNALIVFRTASVSGDSSIPRTDESILRQRSYIASASVCLPMFIRHKFQVVLRTVISGFKGVVYRKESCPRVPRSPISSLSALYTDNITQPIF